MISENNFIKDNGSLHHYRTELPNILIQMRLTPYELATYFVLKQTAGDNGGCFKSNKTLCDEIGIGKSKLLEIKQSLQARGLITITKRKNPKGDLLPDLITIVDIWAMNMKEMLEKYHPSGGSLPRKLGSLATQARGSLPRKHKEEPIQEEPYEEQQQHNEPVQKSAPKKPGNVVVSSEEKEKTKPPENVKRKGGYRQGDKIKPAVYDCLEEVDIPDNNKYEITHLYSEDTVKNAIEATEAAKHKIKTTYVAYLIGACQKGLKAPKKAMSVYEELLTHFKHGEIYNGAECFLREQSIAFQRGMHYRDLMIDSFFSWDKFKAICTSFGIKFERKL